jgi:hypothetical protein
MKLSRTRRTDEVLSCPLAPVAQLDRVPVFGTGGWGFESLRAYMRKRGQSWPRFLMMPPAGDSNP